MTERVSMICHIRGYFLGFNLECALVIVGALLIRRGFDLLVAVKIHGPIAAIQMARSQRFDKLR